MLVKWDLYEVAKLIETYWAISSAPASRRSELKKLSSALRQYGINRGIEVDEKYRNLNGVSLQLSYIEGLYTHGKRGLSGAIPLFREMVALQETDEARFKEILAEANRLIRTHETYETSDSSDQANGKEATSSMESNTSIKSAFLSYVKENSRYKPEEALGALRKASVSCHLNRSLLGITDLKTVRTVQQKVAEGNLLSYKYGTAQAQRVRSIVNLYYQFVKEYRAGTINETVGQSVSDSKPETRISSTSGRVFQVDFSIDADYSFTKPIFYTYKGARHDVASWSKLYVQICGFFFDDYHDSFMRIMNGDIPGFSSLAFADESNYRRMRMPKRFAPGYYLESNMDATSIVRKIRGLHRLFHVGDSLKITYQASKDHQPSPPKNHREIGLSERLPVTSYYDWHQAGLKLVDFNQDMSYTFTQPDAYEYNGMIRQVNKWGPLFADLCGVLFEDDPDTFVSIMNKDIPGYYSLAFADEEHKTGMRVARCFAPGYYFEANVDATTIVRRICGLYRLFSLEGKLKISYRKTPERDVEPSVEESAAKEPSEEWIITALKVNRIAYQDKRSQDGCLWILGGYELDGFMLGCKVHGYTMVFKPDGCKAFPNRSVWWTTSKPEPQMQQAMPLDLEIGNDSLDTFEKFLVDQQHLADRTASMYASAVRTMEAYIQQKHLNIHLMSDDADEAQEAIDNLMSNPDFVKMNRAGHYRYLAAMKQYVRFLQGNVKPKQVPHRTMTVLEAVFAVLRDAPAPMTTAEILQAILDRNLYQFNTEDRISIVNKAIYRHCINSKELIAEGKDVLIQTDEAGKKRYQVMDAKAASAFLRGDSSNTETTNHPVNDVDDRWSVILQESFPDGYILDDFLSQYQASAFWRNRYGEDCPVQGAGIDDAMKAVGTILDGRVFTKNSEGNALIEQITAEIEEILSRYTNVYRNRIYEKYQDELAGINIYSESVMTDQLLEQANGSFIAASQIFAKPGQEASVAKDCKRVLRNHGGAMHVNDISTTLWFIPYDTVYHSLAVDTEALNIGSSTWMMVEHFPFNQEDAAKVRSMLDEYFLAHDYIQAFDLPPLLRSQLPSIADNLSAMTYQAVFKIVEYYLRDRFSFSKAIISPKGTSVDFTKLFQNYSADRDAFTLDDLDAFADELKLPIYWESVYAGGAVRISETEFVNRSQITFDVEATDRVLEDLCPGDYLPLAAISTAMMMHLPSCGYAWNGYLLLSYVQSFSKVFRMSYNSLGKTGFYGAMVRRGCKEIGNYSSLLERVLTDDDTWSTAADALELLVRQGYQANRKYKGIDTIVAKARHNKLMEGR